MTGRDVVTALMTAPDQKTAEAIARTLVEERWIACANVVPAVSSIYRWEGEVRHDAEVLVIMKTTSERAEALTLRAAELHPYDVPEVLILGVEEGHRPYLEWVVAQVR